MKTNVFDKQTIIKEINRRLPEGNASLWYIIVAIVLLSIGFYTKNRGW